MCATVFSGNKLLMWQLKISQKSLTRLDLSWRATFQGGSSNTGMEAAATCPRACRGLVTSYCQVAEDANAFGGVVMATLAVLLLAAHVS